MTETCTKSRTWEALEAHHAKLSKIHLRDLFAEDPHRGERFVVEGAGLFLDYSKNRITDQTLELLLQLAEECGLRARIDGMFRGERINVTENRAVLHVALRAPKGARIEVDGENVVPGVHAVLDKMATFADRVRSGGVEGPHRPSHPERGQRRHRGVRPGPRDGVRSPAPLHPAGHDLPLRLQRRRHRLRGSGPGPGRGGYPVHRLVEDLHHPGDHDERAFGARVAAARPGRGRDGRGEALRGGLDERPRGREVRHRHCQHVRVLGLGRGALLHGLGHRALDHAGRGSGELPAPAGWLPPDGRAFPHDPVRAEHARADGAPGSVVHQLLRVPDRGGIALRAVPQALSPPTCSS